MFIDRFKRYNTIIKNTGYLSVLEIFKLIMPFIALPYIIRVIGAENYGLIAFVQTVISYFSMFVNFGLDISAVRNVALARNDEDKLSEVVSSVLCLKCIFIFISFLFLCILIFFFELFAANKLIFFFAFLSCFSDVLFPVWYYQGMERMKNITLIRFASILFYTASIFIFIHTKDDYVLIPLLQSLGMILSGGISVILLLRRDQIVFRLVDVSILKKYFIESVPFFISRLSVLLNSGMAKLICGTFFSMQSVAAFDVAQKVATTSFVPVQMINQSVFPHISRTLDRKLIHHCFKLILVISFLISGGIFLLAPFIIAFFAGENMPEAIILLRILCFYILCGGVSMFLGTPVLVAFGCYKPFNRSVILSTFILVFLYSILCALNIFVIENFAIVLGLTELSIVFYRLYFSMKYKILSK